jgi:hypothetical protein
LKELQKLTLADLDQLLLKTLKPHKVKPTFGLEFEMIVKNKSDGQINFSTIENEQPTTQIMKERNKNYNEYGIYTHEALGYQAERVTKEVSKSVIQLFDKASLLLEKASHCCESL